MTGIITSLPPPIEPPATNTSGNPEVLGPLSYVPAVPTLTQTWTALQTFNAGTITFAGTGGTSQVVRQSSLNAPLTVGQLAFSDISGTIGPIQLPTPTISTLGGVFSKAAVSHNFLTQIGTDGSISQAQPAASDISGLAASATTDTTNAANISSGTLPAGRLPNPSASTLGGVQSAAAVSHQWINSISTSGVPALSQPAFTDISGSVPNSQLATMAAWTFKANNTSSAATPTDITIDGLTLKASPAASDEVIIWDVAGSALKKATVSGVGSSAGVSSIAGNTGAFTLSDGLSNNVNALYSLQPGAYINKFRNPGMDVAQRGSAAITVTTSGAYTVDGWIVLPTGASITAQQAANGRTGAFSASALQVTGNTSVTDVIIKQRIEGIIATPLAGAVIIFTAQVFNNTGGSITPTLTVKHANALDNWGATTTDVSAQTLQACANSTWTQVSFSFTANSSSGNGLEFALDFGNNFSTNLKSIKLSECDVRIGSQIHTPEIRNIQAESAYCQRYYWRRSASSGSNTDYLGQLSAFNTAGVFGKLIDYPVVMRIAPTVSVSSFGHFSGGSASGTFAGFSTGTLTGQSPFALNVQSLTGASGLTAGIASVITFNNASGWIDASAEL